MENTVAKKLESLEKLQKVDSKIDNIKKIRGALPEEVGDLEDEIAGLETRVAKFHTDLEDLEKGIEEKKQGIKTSETLIKKYEEQQMNVRNNREYDAITKEMELQALEIQVSEKRIKEAYLKIDGKKEEIEAAKEVIEEKNQDLEAKKKELDTLIAESEADETKLEKERKKASKAIDERILTAYNRLRNNAKNGLAVVSVQRHACGGCFNIVPPQRQADIKEKKKVIVCEHCGRILSNVELVIEPEKPKRTVRRKKAVAKK